MTTPPALFVLGDDGDGWMEWSSLCRRHAKHLGVTHLLHYDTAFAPRPGKPQRKKVYDDPEDPDGGELTDMIGSHISATLQARLGYVIHDPRAYRLYEGLEDMFGIFDAERHLDLLSKLEIELGNVNQFVSKFYSHVFGYTEQSMRDAQLQDMEDGGIVERMMLRIFARQLWDKLPESARTAYQKIHGEEQPTLRGLHKFNFGRGFLYDTSATSKASDDANRPSASQNTNARNGNDNYAVVVNEPTANNLPSVTQRLEETSLEGAPRPTRSNGSTTVGSEPDRVWFMTSSSHHATSTPTRDFVVTNPNPVGYFLRSTLGERLPVAAIGNATITVQDSASTTPRRITLYDVLIVPGLVKNVLTMNLRRPQCNVEFSRSGVHVVNAEDDTTYFRASQYSEDSLSVLNTPDVINGLVDFSGPEYTTAMALSCNLETATSPAPPENSRGRGRGRGQGQGQGRGRGEAGRGRGEAGRGRGEAGRGRGAQGRGRGGATA